MRKKALVVILLLCTAMVLPAQEKNGWIGRTARGVVRSLTTPNKIHDTTYVYLLENRWVVSLNADLIWTGVQLNRASTLAETAEVADWMRVENHLRRTFFTKVGAGISFGSLSLGYTTEIARGDTKRNNYFNMSFFRPRFGISVQYYTVHEYLDGSLSFDWDPDYRMDFRGQPGRMRHLVIDAFYFFRPTLNLTARAGFSFSWDRYFLCATAVFNRYYFRETSTITEEEVNRQMLHTKTRGSFYDISARVQFNVRS